MNISFYGKSVKFTDAMKEETTKEFKRIEKFLDPYELVKIAISGEGGDIIISAQAVTKENKRIRSSAISKAEDFYSAVNGLVSDLKKQAVKVKEKVKDKKTVTKEDEEEYFGREVVKVKQFVLTPMIWEKAAEEMEDLGHTFYAFKDVDTGLPSIIYKRFDGEYGIIVLK